MVTEIPPIEVRTTIFASKDTACNGHGNTGASDQPPTEIENPPVLNRRS
jgi:hypothetical protein